MGKNTVDVTDATFDSDVLKSDKTVLVDFWAEWCGPCKMVAPVLDEIAGENKDKITVAKLDIDANPEDGAGLPGHVDPDDDRVPGRQAGQADRRRQARRPPCSRDLADYLAEPGLHARIELVPRSCIQERGTVSDHDKDTPTHRPLPAYPGAGRAE